MPETTDFSAFAAVHPRDGQIATAAAQIKHVFVIMLENKSYSDTFGTSVQDPYLQKTLVPQGALLTEYYGTGHVSLDNYISLNSGQAPTPDTVGDCPTYTDVQQTGTHQRRTGDCRERLHLSQEREEHCPTSWSPGDSRGRVTWRTWGTIRRARAAPPAAIPSMAVRTPPHLPRAPSAAVPLGDAYATRHDPFMYFHSIIDSPTCKTNVVRLEQLSADLAQVRTTPNLSFITPNLCNDGHDGSGDGMTLCKSGQVGGLASIDQFLQTWVPKILASPAFREDGLLIITFDESNYTISSTTDPTTGAVTTNITFPGEACCHEQPGPNLDGIRPEVQVLAPGLNFVYGGYGGDRVGGRAAVALHPSWQHLGYSLQPLLDAAQPGAWRTFSTSGTWGTLPMIRRTTTS